MVGNAPALGQHPPHVMVRNAPALGQHPPHVMVRNAPALGQPHIPMGFRQAFHCEVALFCCLLLPTGSVHVFILLLGLTQSLLKSPFRMRNCQHPSPVHCHVSGQGPQTPHPYRHLLHVYCKGANSSFTLLLWFHFFPKPEFSWGNLPGHCSVQFSHSVMSDSLWPRGLYFIRLPCPWNSPGENTGVGCHSLLQLSSLPIFFSLSIF